MEIEEIPKTTTHDKEDDTILKSLISKVNIDTELILVKPNSPIRICTSALSYLNLPETHIIMVNII